MNLRNGNVINMLEENVLAFQQITQEEARELGKLKGCDLYQLFSAAKCDL